ncbi:MAG: CoB--CoM heterodisulfide reductase iron-sulfur subunit A family protein [Deltaproteobacteria bacterium]|nr:CoB--CoM heterodisulfide reductase iron-sulfur subunit A family protein [Deltaproteobacteria bacterium]
MMSRNDEHNEFLIVGGGVAGITAALDLAETGRDVQLVDTAAFLGGQVAKLDKIYPTDHCAFCPLWTDIKKVRDHPRITVHTSSTLQNISEKDGQYTIVINKVHPVIDESLCIYCRRCLQECSAGAVRPLWEHASPPSFFIDTSICTNCGDCVDICPTGAIDLNRTAVEIVLTVSDIIWATGFNEVDLTPLPEFGIGTHPDIMTSLEFEEWTAEAGRNEGSIIRKSNGNKPQNIAFIQCAGARDQRMLPYCSAVCCMHALKQAQWVKRREPNVVCCIFYTDLRTVGRDYYEYAIRQLEGMGVHLIRGRPGLIYALPDGDGIAVTYENTMTQTREIARFDMVVLNGNLRPSQAQTVEGARGPSLDSEGFVDTTRDDLSRFAGGFTLEPADIAESVIQGSSAAIRVATKTAYKR